MNNDYLQKTSLWKFPNRGNWVTHKGDYRGNWSPHVPRNLILRYSKPGEIILDPFLGSGTTLIECKLLNRNGIGIDINQKALSIAQKRLNFETTNTSEQQVLQGDATNLETFQSEYFDLICAHPPYADSIQYSESIPNDLSLLPLEQFLEKMHSAANEFFRVLKTNKYCAVMIGDIRRNGKIVPLGFKTLNLFKNVRFSLKEIIIKEQFNCRTTRYWENIAIKNGFLLLAHEYIFIFEK